MDGRFACRRAEQVTRPLAADTILPAMPRAWDSLAVSSEIGNFSGALSESRDVLALATTAGVAAAGA